MNADRQITLSIDWMDVLTKTALVLAMVLVAVRLTTLEVVRETMADLPGELAVSGPGPATTLTLDLLCWLPTLLVLVRRAIDRRYTLRLHISHLLMVLLSLWVIVSCFFASDKFVAMINASTWCAAMSIGWATCQLVRSWTRLRMVASIGVGMGLIFVLQAMLYRYWEHPDIVKMWDQTQSQIMQARGWTADDFAFKQFDAKVRRGEMMGFFRSPNTYAATAALCLFVSMGLAIQRLKDRDDPIFPLLIGLPAVLSILIIVFADSRTALAGVVLCAGIFALTRWRRELLIKHRKKAFWGACGIIAAGTIGLVLIGVTTGGLLHDSLTFRWNYWVGSSGIVRDHPLLGVGWGNFANAYLPHRLPVASEEIKDPHNALIKFVTETGVIGLLLAVAWLGRTAWEATQPVAPQLSAASPSTPAASPVSLWAGVPIGFVLMKVIVNFPTAMDGFEPLTLLLYGLLLAMGIIVATARSTTRLIPDDRAASWVMWGVLIGLVGFGLHAMVDFAMFETGPLLLMMLLVGAVLGARHPGAAGRKQRTSWAIALLAMVFFGLMAFVAMVLIPTASAEARSHTARELMQQSRFAAAATELREAMVTSPVDNANYATRAARALMSSNQSNPRDILALLTQAISADPSDPGAWLDRARYAAHLRDPAMAGVDAITTDYLQALARNPNDVASRIELADYLTSAGKTPDAQKQYQIALDFNDRLGPDETKRLPTSRVAEIKAKIDSMR